MEEKVREAVARIIIKWNEVSVCFSASRSNVVCKRSNPAVARHALSRSKSGRNWHVRTTKNCIFFSALTIRHFPTSSPAIMESPSIPAIRSGLRPVRTLGA
jgi:hypothetical protein